MIDLLLTEQRPVLDTLGPRGDSAQPPIGVRGRTIQTREQGGGLQCHRPPPGVDIKPRPANQTPT